MKTKILEYRITNTEISIRESDTGWLTFGIGGPVAGMFLKDIFDEYNRLRRVEAALMELETEAETHRKDYDFRYGTAPIPLDYWKGRRDEAGHFRDRLAAALREAEPEPK